MSNALTREAFSLKAFRPGEPSLGYGRMASPYVASGVVVYSNGKISLPGTAHVWFWSGVSPKQKKGLNTVLKLIKKMFETPATPNTTDVQSDSLPKTLFQGAYYLKHNRRRQEHLASLGLPLENRTVLEVGAGIGDHTKFFVDRHCQVTALEARPENLEILSQTFPQVKTLEIDMDNPPHDFTEKYEIMYCYGLLYHLKNPAEAIAFMAKATQDMMLLETCVSYGEEAVLHFVDEAQDNPTQSFTGVGCRPTRPWVYAELQKYFPHVYMPVTQPDLGEFPTDWVLKEQKPLTRAVFIASFQPIQNPLLVEDIPMQQVKYQLPR